MNELSFFVEGSPAPGGSKTAFVARRGDGSIVMRPGTNMPVINMSDAGGKANKEWRNTVKWKGKEFMRGAPPFDCALKVQFIFFIQRPKCHFRTGKFAHILRDDAPEYHTQAPDALKYARSTEDALTQVIWKDDSQNVRLCTEKRWCKPGEKEGCAITVIFLRPQIPSTLL